MNGDPSATKATPAAPARIFRETALQRLSSPEQLDRSIHVTSPKTWIAVVTGLSLIAAAVIWGIVGTVPLRVSAPGVLADREGKLFPATAQASGMITQVLVKTGERIKVGQTIATLATGDLEGRLAAAKVYLEALVAHRRSLEAARQTQGAAHRAVSESRVAALNQRIQQGETYSTALRSELSRFATGPQRPEIASRIAGAKRSLFDATRDVAAAHGDLAVVRGEDLAFERLGRDRTADLDLRIVAQQGVVDDLSLQLQQSGAVRSPTDGVVVEVSDAVGTVVAAGTRIAMITTMARETDAIVYLQAENYQRVKAGTPALVVPVGVDRTKYGGIIGVVHSVDAYPSDRRTVEATVQDAVFADSINKRGLAYAARVDITESSQTPSGLAWSSSSGPPYAVKLGTPATVYIDVKQEHPAAIVVPALAGLLGF
jgi:HlyD family secretion protein